MHQAAVVMPVGPGDAEVERCRDTIAGIAAWEPNARWIALVDDSDTPRDLEAAVACDGPSITVLRRPAGIGPRVGLLDRIAANVLSGLAWAVRDTPADVIMKVDNDTLAIRPFVDNIGHALRRDPTVGLVGSYSRTVTGGRRDFSPWVARVQRASRRLQRDGRHVRVAVGRRAVVRRLILDARAQGYVWGEHALACAIAMPRPLCEAWNDRGVLDPRLFVGTNLGDDPVLGILVRAFGRRHLDLVDEGDPFAVVWRGLPMPPERLEAGGYSLIHCVKNDPEWSEEQIRAYFRVRRPVRASGEAGSA